MPINFLRAIKQLILFEISISQTDFAENEFFIYEIENMGRYRLFHVFFFVLQILVDFQKEMQ